MSKPVSVLSNRILPGETFPTAPKPSISKTPDWPFLQTINKEKRFLKSK